MRGSRRNPRGITAGVLGAGLVLALLIVGLTSGFGGPDLPEGDVAFVEDVPDGGDITREQFDRAVEQAAAAQGIRRTPKPGTPQYDMVKDAALNDLILSRWVAGEAAERGIEVSEATVADRLEQIKNDQFGSEREFNRFLKRQRFTEEDARDRVRLQVLSERIQESVLGGDGGVSDDDIDVYYESNIEQFRTPETRDVRLVLNPKQEKAEQAREILAEDDSDKSWKRTAKRLSTDEGTSSNGGLRQAVMRGQNEQALDEAIFGAEEGELVGPVETDAGFYVLQVTKINEETTRELDEQTREQIRQTLAAQRQQRLAASFQSQFSSKWRSRTICADDFVTDRCSNAPPPPDACQGDDDGEEPPAPPEGEQEGEQELACPAFVPGRRVVEPGTAGAFGAVTRPQGPVYPQPEAPGFDFGQGLPIGPGG